MASTPSDHDTGISPAQMLVRLAEFQLLPSRSLHHSHHPRFDPDGAWRALLHACPDPAPVHRHWSQEILLALDINTNTAITARHATLSVALLPTGTLEALGTWLGIQLCASRLRTMIHRSELQLLLSLPHADIIRQAQRLPAFVHYPPAQHWSATQIVQDHTDLGHATLLHACSASDETLHRLMTLKLPATQAWPDLPAPDMVINACLEFLTEVDTNDIHLPS